MSTEPIDAGRVRRLVVVALLKIRYHRWTQMLWKRPTDITSMFGICIKVKPYASLAEAHAMQFISQHTKIPVPKLYCAFVYKGHAYIVMSRIKGQVVWLGWSNRTAQSKARILSQLSCIMAELRSVTPPGGTVVGGVCGGPFSDCRLPSDLLWGPFATTRDFHKALANNTDFDAEIADVPDDLRELFNFYRRQGDELVLTHGDLSSLNILAVGDEVTGIIDWETAGWFPPYWEYTNAKNFNPYNTAWKEHVDSFLEPMPNELKMETIRQKYFGAY